MSDLHIRVKDQARCADSISVGRGEQFIAPSLADEQFMLRQRLEPTPAAIPTASTEQGNDKNDDEDCGQVHELLHWVLSRQSQLRMSNASRTLGTPLTLRPSTQARPNLEQRRSLQFSPPTMASQSGVSTKYCLTCEWQHCGSCSAASDRPSNGSSGPSLTLRSSPSTAKSVN